MEGKRNYKDHAVDDKDIVGVGSAIKAADLKGLPQQF